MSSLDKFLTKNTIKHASTLPLVHSTSAYRTKKILREGLIRPQPCDVFKGDDLTYLFYGRPSYKRETDGVISKYWELPVAFIFDYGIINIKRVFPFDTGAFARQYYPEFIQMMDLSEFEATNSIDAPQRLVGSFFVDVDRYFRLKPRSSQDFLSRFHVDVMEEEVRALHDLVLYYDSKIDDRRFSVEIQTASEIDLRSPGVLAIVFPEEYCDSEEFMSLVASFGATPLSYPSYPLKQQMYYQTIYNIVFEFYRSKGLLR